MPISAIELLLVNLLIVVGAMLLLWLISIPIRNVSIVDIFWGPGFGLIALATFLLSSGLTERRVLLTALTCLWALRLGVHLAIRNLGHGEDPRYVKFREHRQRSGKSFVVSSLFTVFLLQGTLMWIISWPIQLAQIGTQPMGLLAVLGTLVWLVGFLFEALGDWQLRRFKADTGNQGKVMDQGLWRYTRHPNYFGNACVWWGLWLVATEAAPIWTLVSPVIMTVLLLKVSGVALLEQSLQQTKPQYTDYVQRTSAFIPRPPRSRVND